MAKGTMSIVEEVLIEYEIHYNEELLHKRNTTLEEHIKKYNKNPWQAMDSDDIITSIEHNQIYEYIDSKLETIEFNY